jgi:cysteinyl-tRNA synthetase
MITIDGQKMGRSLNNFITLDEIFSGDNKLLVKAFPPMTIRFFMLQAHYRSTLDFSNEALQASEKGMNRLFESLEILENLEHSSTSSFDIHDIKEGAMEAMADDLNSPVAIARLFEAAKYINLMKEGKESLNELHLKELKEFLPHFVHNVLGLKSETNLNNDRSAEIIDSILNIRLEAKKRKDFTTADQIRDALTQLGIEIKDKKDGFEWKM